MIEPHLFIFAFQNYIYKYTQHRATGSSWSITTAVVKICHRHSPSAVKIILLTQEIFFFSLTCKKYESARVGHSTQNCCFCLFFLTRIAFIYTQYIFTTTSNWRLFRHALHFASAPGTSQTSSETPVMRELQQNIRHQ